mmetsp:Transcript_16487/g.23338  ORF Transcript_16487/g.23338 Transcript_16487/m.23338 type:complete len:111 (-) Transcript_16487:324-656(-)
MKWRLVSVWCGSGDIVAVLCTVIACVSHYYIQHVERGQYFDIGDNGQGYVNILYSRGRFCCQYAVVKDVFWWYSYHHHHSQSSLQLDTIKLTINLRCRVTYYTATIAATA